MKIMTLENIKQFKKLLYEDLGVSVDPGEVVEMTYEYNGDTSSDDITWVTNYGGIKVFAKMGDLPKGTLNLVGSTLFRTNPNNQWLDKTFTITEEHLTKVLNKASTDIPATQEGLIQIYDMMASDFSEFFWIKKFMSAKHCVFNYELEVNM